MWMQQVAAFAGMTTAAVILYKIGYWRGGRCRAAAIHKVEQPTTETIKAELLTHLANRSYVKLAPSAIAGVGVFAVIDIPTNSDPFDMPNRYLRAPERPIHVLFVELLRCCPPDVLDHVVCSLVDRTQLRHLVCPSLRECRDSGRV